MISLTLVIKRAYLLTGVVAKKTLEEEAMPWCPACQDVVEKPCDRNTSQADIEDCVRRRWHVEEEEEQPPANDGLEPAQPIMLN
jgi:hypothetical protein